MFTLSTQSPVPTSLTGIPPQTSKVNKVIASTPLQDIDANPLYTLTVSQIAQMEAAQAVHNHVLQNIIFAPLTVGLVVLIVDGLLRLRLIGGA